MDYNYYPQAPQPGGPQMPNEQASLPPQPGCSPQMQLMQTGNPNNLMHASPIPQPQGGNIRQVVTPGPPLGHPQMQPQQQPPQSSQQHLLGHPMQPQMVPQQQQQQQVLHQPPPHHHPSPHSHSSPSMPSPHHPNYHQLPPSHHPSPLPPHSGSPLQQPLHTNMNLQPPPRPSTGPSPQQHPHMHHQQSPHHGMGSGPPVVGQHPTLTQQQPPQQQQSQQQLSHIGGGPSPQILLPPGQGPPGQPSQTGPPPPNQGGGGIPPPQAQPGMQHNQNFMGPSPMSQHGPPHPHYSTHQPHHPSLGPPPNGPPPPPLHGGPPQHGPPPPPSVMAQNHHPHHPHHPPHPHHPHPHQQQQQPPPPPPNVLLPGMHPGHPGPPPPPPPPHGHPHGGHPPPGPPPPQTIAAQQQQQQLQPPPPGYGGPVPIQSSLERGSPFYQNIPQTEFRIIELNKRLQNRPRTRGPQSPLPLIGSFDESYWWDKFACEFFDDDSTLTLRILAEDKPIEYTIGRTLIPRFFRSYFEGGVIDLSIKLRNTRETMRHHHLITLDCDQTDIITKNMFKHTTSNLPMNVVVHTEGHLSLDFVNTSFDTLLIKSWRFYTTQCHEYIDRSMTTTGLPNNFLIEPVTRFGLTKSTISYLKMCMIMEPMQDLMLQHRQTKMDPRSCLKRLLTDKYGFKIDIDNRAQPNKRRKRRTPAANAGANKKTKANAAAAAAAAAAANNSMNNNNNNIGFNNNIGNNLMTQTSVAGVPNLHLASSDVMTVGEPSMLGADFGDENERRITRLENNQFDQASINSNNNNNNNNNSSGNNNNITSNNTISQNPNQIYSNANNQNPNQLSNGSGNNITHMQPQQNNHDTGSSNIQMINQANSNSSSSSSSSSSNNNNNSNNNNTSTTTVNNNNGTSDPISGNTNNGSNNCIPTNNNGNNGGHQVNMIQMNGNHVSHIVKSEIDLKQTSAPTPTTTTTDSEPR